MHNAELLPRVRADIDPRGEYERELAARIEVRRIAAQAKAAELQERAGIEPMRHGR